MDPRRKKHPCTDCRQCQWCGDDRCRLCLGAASGCRRKLTMAEQIALFERLNAGENPEESPRAAPFDLENSAHPLK